MLSVKLSLFPLCGTSPLPFHLRINVLSEGTTHHKEKPEKTDRRNKADVNDKQNKRNDTFLLHKVTTNPPLPPTPPKKFHAPYRLRTQHLHIQVLALLSSYQPPVFFLFFFSPLSTSVAASPATGPHKYGIFQETPSIS